MTLSRRMIGKIVAITCSVLLLCAASLWGLGVLSKSLHSSLEEYTELRMLEFVQLHAEVAKSMLECQHPNQPRIIAELSSALATIREYKSFQRIQAQADPIDQRRELMTSQMAENTLSGILVSLRKPDSRPSGDPNRDDHVRSLSAMLAELTRLSQDSESFVAQTQVRASEQVRQAVWLLGGLTVVIILTKTILNISQYRSIVLPLGRLRCSVRAVADGRFGERLDETGDLEFRELAMDFNRMAEQLDTLYRQLEDKVRQKSRELVQSERLASVGYLAAGVAHEINNPLAIMSGHAELLIKQLDHGEIIPQDELRQALDVIREEAFRCKGITEKLLTLSRGGSEQHELVSLRRIVEDVVSMMTALPPCRERRLVMRLPERDPLLLDASMGELKQVLLNLTVNALEAVPPGTGIVLVEARRCNGQLELVVRDNGRGMSPKTIEEIFEPFFTDRRGAGERGTGLGLSITHAIVQAHGGTICAASEGIGRGSVFTVCLPAIVEQVGHEGPAQAE